MKMRGILLILLLSFAGVSLVGCPEWFASDSAKLAKEAKDIAGEAKTIATKQKEDNPSPPADHSVCDEAIADADTAIAAAEAVKDEQDEEKAKQAGEAAKTAAEAAKTKAEGCAKGAAGGGDDTTEEPSEKRAFWKHYLSASVVTTPPPKPDGSGPSDKHSACPEGITEFNAPGEDDDCAKGTGCEAKATEWKTAQEAAGYTCTEEEKQLTAFRCTTSGPCLGAACAAYKEVQYKCTK